MFQPNARVMYVPEEGTGADIRLGTVVGHGTMRAPLNCITSVRIGEGQWQHVTLVVFDRETEPTCVHADNLRPIHTHTIGD